MSHTLHKEAFEGAALLVAASFVLNGFYFNVWLHSVLLCLDGSSLSLQTTLKVMEQQSGEPLNHWYLELYLEQTGFHFVILFFKLV